MHAQRHGGRYSATVPHLTPSTLCDDEGKVETILSPAVVLPEQLYRSPVIGDTHRGEVALMRAVLEDAVGCFHRQFVSRRHRDQRLAREAEEWFFAEDHRPPFSFENICAVLGLDPEYIRLGLKRWRQRAQASPLEKQPCRTSPDQRFKRAA